MQYRIDFYSDGELTEQEQEKIIGLLDYEKDNPEIFM